MFCHISVKSVSIDLKLISEVEDMSRSLSELFAVTSDSRWPTGGHFEFSKMGGDVKQLLPIFEDVRAIDNFLVYIESRHPRLHAHVFGFLLS